MSAYCHGRRACHARSSIREGGRWNQVWPIHRHNVRIDRKAGCLICQSFGPIGGQQSWPWAHQHRSSNKHAVHAVPGQIIPHPIDQRHVGACWIQCQKRSAFPECLDNPALRYLPWAPAFNWSNSVDRNPATVHRERTENSWVSAGIFAIKAKSSIKTAGSSYGPGETFCHEQAYVVGNSDRYAKPLTRSRSPPRWPTKIKCIQPATCAPAGAASGSI